MERRTPSTRDRFPTAALDAFRKMVELEEQSDVWPPADAEWVKQHDILHDALHLKPWQYFAVHPPWLDGERSPEEATLRYIALAEAAGIELDDA